MRGIIGFNRLRLVLFVVLAVPILGAGVSGASAKTPKGGHVKFWATPTTTGASDLVVAGAVGDYGSSLRIDQNGKADPKGDYAKVTLQNGTFRLNLTAFNAASKKASFPINKAAGCSSEGAIRAPVAFSSGTGLYKGIAGKGHITLTVVWIPSSPSSGKCDGSKVLFQSQYLTGSGTVSLP